MNSCFCYLYVTHLTTCQNKELDRKIRLLPWINITFMGTFYEICDSTWRYFFFLPFLCSSNLLASPEPPPPLLRSRYAVKAYRGKANKCFFNWKKYLAPFNSQENKACSKIFPSRLLRLQSLVGHLVEEAVEAMIRWSLWALIVLMWISTSA